MKSLSERTYLIELLLPLQNSRGVSIPQAFFHNLQRTLTNEFGGVTAFTRSPADGRWKDDQDHTVHDEIVVLEVMTEAIDHAWWHSLRTRLEETLDQDLVVIRATACEQL